MSETPTKSRDIDVRGGADGYTQGGRCSCVMPCCVNYVEITVVQRVEELSVLLGKGGVVHEVVGSVYPREGIPQRWWKAGKEGGACQVLASRNENRCTTRWVRHEIGIGYEIN